MYAIYRNSCDNPFIGVIAKTEAEAWDYIDKTYGLGKHNAFIVKKVILVE